MQKWQQWRQQRQQRPRLAPKGAPAAVPRSVSACRVHSSRADRPPRLPRLAVQGVLLACGHFYFFQPAEAAGKRGCGCSLGQRVLPGAVPGCMGARVRVCWGCWVHACRARCCAARAMPCRKRLRGASPHFTHSLLCLFAAAPRPPTSAHRHARCVCHQHAAVLCCAGLPAAPPAALRSPQAAAPRGGFAARALSTSGRRLLYRTRTCGSPCACRSTRMRTALPQTFLPARWTGL